MNNRKIILGVIGAVIGIIALFSIRNIWAEVDAGEIVVVQYLNGKLEVFDQPTNFAPKWWGKATHYKRSNQFEFLLPAAKDDADNSIKIGFNDGGFGWLSGSIRYDMPTSKDDVIRIHTHFGSQESVEAHLIKTNIEKATSATGPLMSSRESFAERKNDMIFYIEDQASKGAYKTQQVEKEEDDPLTNTKKVVMHVQILKDSTGQFQRQEISPIVQEGIRLYNLSIREVKYDDAIKNQISAQQKAIMQVQTSIAEAKTAEQKTITVAKEGEAKAAAAKWEQETIKAQKVTEAEQELAVQNLNTQKAAAYKQQQILEGEGEGAKKRAIMQANGALEQKLDAYMKVQQMWSDAFAKYQGALVPAYISGGGGGNQGVNAGTQFMELMNMKAMKDLNLDANPNTKNK